MHNINEYILMFIYILVIKNEVTIFYRIIRKFNFVDNLKAYILINNNII